MESLIAAVIATYRIQMMHIKFFKMMTMGNFFAKARKLQHAFLRMPRRLGASDAH